MSSQFYEDIIWEDFKVFVFYFSLFMWTIFKVFTEFATILLLFYDLVFSPRDT